jgi:hypothetical protein
VSCCTQGSICFELVKGLPAAVVALIIGLIAAGIAYRQYKVAQAKLKLDLFERRFVIFHKTWEILSETATKGTREHNYGLATPFNNFLPEAAFLFGPDVEKYLDNTATKWTELYGIEGDTNNAARHAAKKAELQGWFFDQANKGVKEIFGRYLNFHKWK